MITLDMIGKIRRLSRRGKKSEREISRLTGRSRKTVARWLHGEGPAQFTEFASQVFDFANTSFAGTFFQLVVRKTSASGGYANYRIFPLDVNGVPIAPATTVPLPAAFWLLGSAVAGIRLLRRHGPASPRWKT